MILTSCPLVTQRGLREHIQLSDANSAVAATTASEPFSRPHEPRADRAYPNDSQRHARVVEGLGDYGVDGREAEGDGDEADPEAGDYSDRFASPAKVKRPAFEVARPDEGDTDGDTVGEEEADRGDRGSTEEGGCGA